MSDNTQEYVDITSMLLEPHARPVLSGSRIPGSFYSEIGQGITANIKLNNALGKSPYDDSPYISVRIHSVHGYNDMGSIRGEITKVCALGFPNLDEGKKVEIPNKYLRGLTVE